MIVCGYRSGSTQPIGKFVIEFAVTYLICMDGDDDIMQPYVGREFQVINSDSGRWNIGVIAVVHPSQILGVAVNRFFLQVRHDTVRGGMPAVGFNVCCRTEICE